MKNILVLTGSPRKGGNSDLMADTFIKIVRENQHQVTKFQTAFKNIAPCKACDKCWSQNSACVFHDDFDELQPLIENADVLVFVAPLYWFSMPAQIKSAIDRLYSYTVENAEKSLSIRESILLSCAGLPEKNVFDGIVGSYQRMMEYLNIYRYSILTINTVSDKGDILTCTDEMKKLSEIANAL